MIWNSTCKWIRPQNYPQIHNTPCKTSKKGQTPWHTWIPWNTFSTLQTHIHACTCMCVYAVKIAEWSVRTSDAFQVEIQGAAVWEMFSWTWRIPTRKVHKASPTFGSLWAPTPLSWLKLNYVIKQIGSLQRFAAKVPLTAITHFIYCNETFLTDMLVISNWSNQTRQIKLGQVKL